TSACAVGSIHEEFPGRHGHALKLGSSSTTDGSSLWTRRNFSPFSLPEVSSSQLTPRRNASSCAPRRQCRVTASAVVQCGSRTAAQACQLPSGSCQERISFQPSSKFLEEPASLCSAITSYTVVSIH